MFNPLRVVITNFPHPEVRDIAQARVLLPLQWPLQLLTVTCDCNSCRLLRWNLRIFPRTPAKEHIKCRLVGSSTSSILTSERFVRSSSPAFHHLQGDEQEITLSQALYCSVYLTFEPDCSQSEPGILSCDRCNCTLSWYFVGTAVVSGLKWSQSSLLVLGGNEPRYEANTSRCSELHVINHVTLSKETCLSYYYMYCKW